MAPATARTKRATTNPRSGLQIRRMILLDVLLLITLRLIPNEVLCMCRRLIHPSAWKMNSANFRCRGFSELGASWENGPIVNRTAYVAIYSRVSPQYHG